MSNPLSWLALFSTAALAVAAGAAAKPAPRPCSSSRSRPFQTALWITHSSEEEEEALQLVTQEDWSRLGNLLVETYNTEQQQYYCDPYYRRLVSATVARYPDQELSQQQHDKHLNSTTVRYDVEGYCEGCETEEEVLFDTTLIVSQQGRTLRGSNAPEDCQCRNSSALPRAPKQDEFRTSWRKALQQQTDDHRRLQSSTVQVSVSIEPEPSSTRVDDLINVDEYDCTAPKARFHSTVFVRVSNETSLEDPMAFQDTFQSAYNNLTFSLCDVAHFRQIVSVTVLESNSSGWVAEEALDTLFDQDTTNTNIIALQIETECQDCNSTTPLFHVIPPRATLAPEETPVFNPGGSAFPFGGAANSRPEEPVQKRMGACLCPKNDTNVFRAPTAHEFQQHLQAYLPSIRQVEEEKRVDCERPESTRFFATYAHVDWDVKFQSISTREQALLEQSFRETYNQLSYIQCDRYHRQIVNVTLLRDHVATTLEFSQDYYSNGTDLNLTRTTVFQIEAECHGCPVGNDSTDEEVFVLFDHSNATGRFLSESSTLVVGKDRQLIAADADICTCAPGTLEGESPTEEDFLQAFNHNLDDLLLSTVESAEDVTEGMQVECGSNASFFTSKVYADVSLDIDALTRVQRTLLEETFGQVYNELTFQGCDGNFRSIANVTMDENDPAMINIQNNNDGEGGQFLRHLIASNGTAQNEAVAPQNWTEVTTAAVFEVVGECRNCNITTTGTFTLFDDVFRRRSLEQEGQFGIGSLGLVERKLEDSAENLCLCPVGLEPGPNQGPTSSEFQAALSARIYELQRQGRLPPISAAAYSQAAVYSPGASGEVLVEEEPVVQLVEIQPVECSSNLTRFQSAVYTGLRVDRDQFGRVELITITETFRNVYNNLNFLGCDSYFRTITDVELIVGNILGTDDIDFVYDGRRLQDIDSNVTGNVTGNATDALGNSTIGVGNATNATELEPTYFVVTGECRNCPITKSGSFNLFDDAFRRRLEQSMVQTMSMIRQGIAPDRHLMEIAMPDDTCYCPTGLQPGIGPSATDFSSILDDVILGATDGESVALHNNNFGIRELDISCTQLELEIVEAEYDVPLPKDIFSLSRGELRSFIDMAYPEAYNEARVGECSPVVLQTTILDRRRLAPIATERRRVRLIFIQPVGLRVLFENPAHEERVAFKLQQIYERTILGRQVTFDTTEPSAGPTRLPTPRPTRQPTDAPRPQPRPEPAAAAATPRPTPNPTNRPTSRPTPDPTNRPTNRPTPNPTASPTKPPTKSPTSSPTPLPTPSPTPAPTPQPTPQPTDSPTPGPTPSPTPIPSTLDPSQSPTQTPTESPSNSPTDNPTTLSPTWERASLAKFNLIDCADNSVIRELVDNDVLNRAVLPTDITIEAVTEPAEIGEVRFFLDDELVEVEGKVPYSLSSNKGNGDFRPSNRLEPSDNVRTLEAVPIWWWGIAGDSLRISFTVVNIDVTS